MSSFLSGITKIHFGVPEPFEESPEVKFKFYEIKNIWYQKLTVSMYATVKKNLNHRCGLQCWPKETLRALFYEAKVTNSDACSTI